MRFKKIKITGFKGFADPVELFLEEGLSGVVGPNGCGKSNLVEAVGWVMGENRPTFVRAGSMDDVIFNGAASRPARGHAEVALSVFLDRPLPASLGGGTGNVDISRRIDRNGTSVFRINGREARRRDVQLLFADSSTGSRSTALVRQGQVGELINASPIGRSAILDNAAGISGLHQRRHEAELKLGSAEKNLSRISDLVDQLKKSRDALQRQAGQARRFRKLSDRLQELEMTLACRKWQEADKRSVNAQALMATKTAEMAKLEARSAKVRRRRDKCKEKLEPLLARQSSAEAQLQRTRMELERLDDQAHQASRSITSLYAQIKQIEKDLERERDLESDARVSVQSLDESRSGLAKSDKDYQEQLARIERLCSGAAEKLGDTESRYEELNRRYIQAITLQRQAGESRDRLEERVGDIGHEIAKFENLISNADAGRRSAESEFATAREDIVSSEAQVAAASAGMEDAEASRVEAIAELERAELAHSEAVSLQRVHETEAENLAGLLNAENPEEHGRLRSISVNKGYEKALGAALGDDLFIGEANENRDHGWIELKNAIPTGGLPDGVERLSNHVTAPAWLERRLGQVGLSSRAKAAGLQESLHPGQCVVTLDGDVIRWDGLITSSKRLQSRAAIRLAQINRLAELSDLIETAGEDTRQKLQDLELARRERDRHSSGCTDARRHWHEAEKNLARARERLAAARTDLNTSERNLETLRTGRMRMQEDLEAAERELSTATEHYKGDECNRVSQEQLETARNVFQAAQAEFNRNQLEFVELRRNNETRIRRLKEMEQEIVTWEKRGKLAGVRIAELEERRASHDREHRNALQLPDQLARQRDDLADKITRQESSCRHLTDQIALAERALQDETGKEQKVMRMLQAVREDRVRAEMGDESAGSALEEAVAAIRDTYGTSPGSLAEKVSRIGKLPEGMDNLEHEIANLRRRREAIGAVNLRADSDMQALDDEMSSIVNEKEEIETAIRKIRDSITRLNREGKSRLTDAFENVRTNFQFLFTSLFEGGKADLELIESEDPLRNGLEIRCHPPGKRQTTLSLMSGGEQTLTSLALIFAFFLTNPAPVCVLDEVDSPLDDANVIRLCNLLDDMVRKTGTRFMIVTHNAITMSRMDRLYGITMQEKGVSQLVQVELREAEKMAA